MTTSGGDILTTILSGCDNGGDEEHKLKKKMKRALGEHITI